MKQKKILIEGSHDWRTTYGLCDIQQLPLTKSMKAFNLGKYSVDIEELVAPMSNSNYFTFLICDRNIQKQKK